MSVDPLADDPSNTAWSPYAAMWGNPVKYIDPDGQLPVLPILEAIVDVGFTLYDAGKIAVNYVRTGEVDPVDVAALGADATAILIPFASGAGLGVRATAKATDKARDVLKANRAAGKKGEALATSDLKKEFPNDDVLQQVTGRFDDGTSTRFDDVIVDPKTGKPRLMNETKVGGARHSKQQSRFHKKGESVTLTGRNAGSAAGRRVNSSTTKTRTTRIKREDLKK